MKMEERTECLGDSYNPDSLKSRARAKRGKGVQRRVVPVAAIPGHWHEFLREDCNKTKLFWFLSEALLKWFNNKDKQLAITDGEAGLSKPTLPYISSLTPCNHEEDDNRMMCMYFIQHSMVTIR